MAKMLETKRRFASGLKKLSINCLFGAFTIIPFASAFAGDVSVDVGVSDANVCLGSVSDAASHGGKKTGRSGSVVFRDVPSGLLKVTVSKSGYKSQSRKINLGASASAHVPIRQGVGGPTCVLASVEYPAASEQTDQQNSYSLKLFRVSLNNGANTTSSSSVTINSQVQGNPTHYRASESPVFDGADWQTYQAAPKFKLSSGKGIKVVYFQVRKTVSVGGGEIQRESSITSDSIVVQ